MSKCKEIFAALKADHDKHRQLLSALASTHGDSSERCKLFAEFTYEAKGHAAAEEQAFYSTLMRKPGTTDEARHSVSEHKEIEDLLNELAATDMASGAWLVRFRTLRNRYLHHVQEEEDEVFPAAAKVLTAEDERHMQAVFERRKVAEKREAEITPEKEPAE